MVKWRPHGSMIPTTIEEWESEFEEFKKFPEYQMKRKYENFGLEEFKFIYFMEWAHRMAGR
jgi:cytochrome c oxidase assembly protein subunit 15